MLEEISDQVKGAGLDPLPIPDIQLPFSMDNVSHLFCSLERYYSLFQIGHIIQSNVNVQKGTLLAALLPMLAPLCGECGKLLSGEVSLTQGVLTGLSRIVRSGPVVMDWQDSGAIKLLAGLKVAGLRAPFKGAASVKDMNVNPDINTRVEDVGINFGFHAGGAFEGSPESRHLEPGEQLDGA